MAKPMPTDISDDVKGRFWAKVDVRGPDECWEWRGYRNSLGYARFAVTRSAAYQAHRLALWLSGTPIEPHQVTDHLCRNSSCCNPSHLEAVSNQENVLRGHSGKVRRAAADQVTACPDGHEYTPENTYVCKRGMRSCRACHRRRANERNARIRALSLATSKGGKDE